MAKTLHITLYIRAMESQHPDALIKEEKAVALVTKMPHPTWTTTASEQRVRKSRA